MRHQMRGQGLLESLVVVAVSAIAALGVVIALARLAEWSARLNAISEPAEPIAIRRGSIETPAVAEYSERKPESLRANPETGAPDG